MLALERKRDSGDQGHPNWFSLNISAVMIKHLSHTMNSVIKTDNAPPRECPVVG